MQIFTRSVLGKEIIPEREMEAGSPGKKCKVSKEEMGTWLSKEPHLWWEAYD